MSFGADNYPRIRNETCSPSSHLDYCPINSDSYLYSSLIYHDFFTLNHLQSFKLPSSNGDLTSNLFFSPLETLSPQGCVTDVSLVFEAADGFGGSQSELQYPINGFPFTSSSSQVMWEDSTSTTI